MASTKHRKLGREFRKLEFIIESGRRGSHLLFTPSMIQQCFTYEEKELNSMLESNFAEINDVINDTLYFPTFEEKRDYIQSLPDPIRNALIFGYFELIGGNLLENRPSLH